MNTHVYEHISKQMNDPIIERRTCTISGKKFAIFQSDKEFYDKISPTFDGKIYQIPFPELCPEERQKKRMVFRNERKLYKRTCDLTGKAIISIYSPETRGPVYDQTVRWSDQRDPMNYGRDFDFSKTFTEQFGMLINEVPKINLNVQLNENAEYTNQVRHSTNCYMCFDSGYIENCLYCTTCFYSKNCIDCFICYHCDNCYETIQSDKCHNCFYVTKCQNCYKARESYNCKNCSYIIGCSNLQNQSYCINNKQVTPEEFDIFMQTYQHHHTDIHIDHVVRPQYDQVGCQQCIGDLLLNDDHCRVCFNATNSQDCTYCYTLDDAVKDSMDLNNCAEGELLFENVAVAGYNSMFSLMSIYGEYNMYSMYCRHSQYLFGCIGLRNKEYCIFNKQYTKHEWEVNVSKIIAHMQSTGERGQFFDARLSPFGYNETIAHEYFPLDKQDATTQGYHWHDKEYHINIPTNKDTIDATTLPETIDNTTDDILHKVIIGMSSGKPYRIMQGELSFYRKHHIPLPRKHPDIRHQARITQRPKRDLHLRKSDKSGKDILSVYSENMPFPVYSLEEYEQEIYS